MTLEPPVLTLDGPSGSGKGTVGQYCAQKLGWHYLDSGAVYRALAYEVHSKSIENNNIESILEVAKHMDFKCIPNPPGASEIRINGVAAGPTLRTEEIGALASQLASEYSVRQALLTLQRNARQPPGLVADGRDMGTVVFPAASLKIFLTANAEERAKRRYNQLKLKDFDVSLADLFQAIQERDARDSERLASPLRPADDAIIIDSSNLSIEEVVTQILNLLDNQLNP